MDQSVKKVRGIIASTSTGGRHVLHILSCDQGPIWKLYAETRQDVLRGDVYASQATHKVLHVLAKLFGSVLERHEYWRKRRVVVWQVESSYFPPLVRLLLGVHPEAEHRVV